jgi:O-antigen ligase
MVTQICDNKIKYLQVILISFGILGFQLISNLPEFFGLDSRIVSIPYRAFYLLICILTILHFKWGNKINKFFVPILIFIFFYFLRSVYDSITQYKINECGLVDFWLFAYIIGFFPMLPFLFRVNLVSLDRAKLVLFILAIFVNLLGLKNNYEVFNDGSLGGRFVGNEVLNQISYGQTGVVLVIMCLSYFYSQKITGKLSLIPLIGLGLMNVALSGSRGPMIELALAIVCFIIINFKKIGVLNLSLVFLLFIGFGIYYSDYLIFFNTVLDRLQETSFNQGGGSEERYFLFKEAWMQFLANPIFGYKGIGVYPHNLILESFMALGILGGLLMIFITIISIRNCITLIKIEATNWIALIFFMHIIGTFISGAIWNSFEFWSLLALSFSLNKNKNIYII